MRGRGGRFSWWWRTKKIACRRLRTPPSMSWMGWESQMNSAFGLCAPSEWGECGIRSTFFAENISCIKVCSRFEQMFNMKFWMEFGFNWNQLRPEMVAYGWDDLKFKFFFASSTANLAFVGLESNWILSSGSPPSSFAALDNTDGRTHLKLFVSHKCNSPNAPVPSFSTMTNECRGNSGNCCKSSSIDIASVMASLYPFNRFAPMVFVECIVPLDGVCVAVLQIAVVA